MDFKDQYRHPNWQKKRLEVLGHYGFVCSDCGSDDRQLHVHHKQYLKGRMIWDYDLDGFDVLCGDCHADAHMFKDAINGVMASVMPSDMYALSALLAGFAKNISGQKIAESFDGSQEYFIGRLSWLLYRKYSVDQIKIIGDFLHEFQSSDAVSEIEKLMKGRNGPR